MAPMVTYVVNGLLAALLLSGCGFHLRTWNLEGTVDTARITANVRNPLAEPLRRGLQSAGVELVESPEDADVLIELLADKRGRRSVSVTSRARAAEYETSLQVQYAIHGKDEKVLIESRWMRASRIYQVDAVNIVGGSEEETLLEREMVNDLVQQLIRSLNAVTREQSSAG
jgi:LPS-assembly lipoprotein